MAFMFRTLISTCLISVLFILGGCTLTNTKISESGNNSAHSNSNEGSHAKSGITQNVSVGFESGDTKGKQTTLKSVASELPDDPDEKNLWERLRKGYQLPIIFNERVSKEIKRYAKHQNYVDRVITRAEPYLYLILSELEKRGMPSEIALLPVVESAFDPFARSHVNAAGIWQIMPRTGKSLGLKQNWWYDGRRDILASTNAALDYLEKLHKRFDGDWLLALAAYNSGGGNVSRSLKKNKRLNRELDFWNLDLPKETKDYVPRLVAFSLIVSSPSTYSLTLKEIENRPYLTKVDVESQIDLAQAAELAEISMDELYELNPGLNQWATDPNGPHHLLLPIPKAGMFTEKLAQLPKSERMTWRRYIIRKGDNLSSLAKKYQLSVSAIRELNGLANDTIQQGQTILLPKAAQASSHYSKSVTQRLARNRLNSNKKSGIKTVYTVQSGDNLWAISKRYGVSTKQILSWNRSTSSNNIRPGQKLVIWSKKAVPINKQKLSYKVQKGDTLSRIAKRYNVAIKDIKIWNTAASKKYLQPGQALTLFVDSAKH